MKTLNYKIVLVAIFVMSALFTFAQQPALQYYRTGDTDGLNVFETSKNNDVAFDGLKVRVGADFALQFQGISQGNASDSLLLLGKNLNLPTANLNLDAQLADGLRVHLRTYLSARHHNEAWVKGGYLQMDKLDFIKPGFAEGIMKYTTIRVGLDEINYGDAHFRRTDNARAYYNPFVGNYIMDAFTTEAFGEVNVQANGLIAVLGVSNGKLNQSVILNSTKDATKEADNKLSFYGKVGYDKQLNEDLRVRLTGSWYMNKGLSTGAYLYAGDRAGDRYYNTFITYAEAAAGTTATSAFRNARVNPGFKQMTAVQVNPFVKFKGAEFFGIYEVASNSDDQGNGKYTQLAAELLYRFGNEENLFVGARYNTVKGQATEAASEVTTNRFNVGGGWFLTKNVVTKVEYVNQEIVDGTGKWDGAYFKGFMIEAAIGF